jgi:hypothetical protein
MKTMRLVRGTAALIALTLCVAAPLSAQQYPAQPSRVQPYPAQYAPPPQSAPLAYSGLDCSRCGTGSYCVVNPLRFEYACAPTNTYACAGISRTGFCPYGTTCWDGVCR